MLKRFGEVLIIWPLALLAVILLLFVAVFYYIFAGRNILKTEQKPKKFDEIKKNVMEFVN